MIDTFVPVISETRITKNDEIPDEELSGLKDSLKYDNLIVDVEANRPATEDWLSLMSPPKVISGPYTKMIECYDSNDFELIKEKRNDVFSCELYRFKLAERDGNAVVMRAVREIRDMTEEEIDNWPNMSQLNWGD